MAKVEVFEAEQSDQSRTFAQEQFEAGLQWLQSRGAEIQRHKLPATGPVLVENTTVTSAVELQGRSSLPITVLDGTIIGIGGYPTRAELLASAGYQATEDPAFLCEALALAAGVGAALAANNLGQFRIDYERARDLGIPAEGLRSVIESAKAAGGGMIRDETLTKMEQFLAFGPAGKPKAPRCTCSE